MTNTDATEVSPQSADAVIEFCMDEAYFREYHSQWVAIASKWWRFFQGLGLLSAVAGVVIGSVDSLDGHFDYKVLVATCIGIGVYESWSQFSRRKVWLDYCRRLSDFNREMRIEVREGKFFQTKPEPTDQITERSSILTQTPKGYFISIDLESPVEKTAANVLDSKSSIYIPRRAIRPQMSRDEFMALVEGASGLDATD
jgi:hypothetical protein